MKVKMLNFDFGESDNIFSSDFYSEKKYFYADNFIPSEYLLKKLYELVLSERKFPNKIWNLKLDREGNLEMKSTDNIFIFTCKLFIKELGLSNLSLINTEDK